MWHAADGDLHAYLDGSLDVYAPSDAERIRDHLESCAECQQRLVVESATAASAREVLAQAAPSEIVAPPFEELRRRALGDAPPASRARAFPLTRLAWAATVILALGIGWGVGVRPGPLRGPAVEEASEAGAVPAAPDAERDQAPPEVSAAEAAASEPATASPGDAGGAASANAPREQRAVEPRTPIAQSALADARANVARVDSIASTLAASPTARVSGEFTPPAPSVPFRAYNVTPEGVRGGVAPGRQAAAARPASTDSVVTSPPNPTVTSTPTSPFAGRALGLDGGRITGLTLVAGTQAPMSDVQVYLVGQTAGALSRQNGQYVITNVPPGSYELRAERIGMTPQSRQVTVAAGQNLEANFDMAGQALSLDEVVVTGQAGALRRREIGNTIAQIPAAPLSLPGVPISAVEWVEVAPGVPGIRVVQGVDGVPVELYFVGVQLESAEASGAQIAAAPPSPPAAQGGIAAARAAAAPDSAVEPSPTLMNVPLPAGWRQLAQRFRGGLVIIRAPLSDARLRELLALAGAPLS